MLITLVISQQILMEIGVLFSFGCGNLSHIRHSRAQLYPTAQPECIDGNAIKLWFLRDGTQKSSVLPARDCVVLVLWITLIPSHSQSPKLTPLGA